MNITASMVKELREVSGAGMLDCKQALTETNGDMDAAMNFLREKGIAKSEKKASRIAAEGLANVYENGNKAVIVEVNSETDFVAKNEEFTTMIDVIGNAILNSDVKTVEEALELSNEEEGTISAYITSKIAKIGEKLSLRRFELVSKSDSEVFGSYIHMGGKIAVLVKIEGSNVDAAKDVAMQSAAMRPSYCFSEEVPSEVLDNEREVLKNQAIEEGKPADIAEKMVEGRIKKYFKENCLAEQVFVKDDSLTVSAFLSKNDSKLVSMIRFEVGEGMEKKEENFAEEVMKQIG